MHQSASSILCPFHAYTPIPAAAMAAAAWSWVEKILHELHLTSAPKAIKVLLNRSLNSHVQTTCNSCSF